MSIATKQLEECLEEIETMKQLLISYDTTQEIIAKMESENDSKLKEVARRQHSVGLKIKSLQNNPQINSQQNSPLLTQLKSGLKEVIMKTKNYPQWSVATNKSTTTNKMIRRPTKVTKNLDRQSLLKSKSEDIISVNNNETKGKKLNVNPFENHNSVKDLLIELGLEEDIQLMEESEIDLELLEKCSKDDLGELGLSNISISKLYNYFNPSFAPLPPSSLEECLSKSDNIKYLQSFEEDEIGVDMLGQVGPEEMMELGLTKEEAVRLYDVLHPVVQEPKDIEEFLTKLRMNHLLSKFQEFEVNWRILKMAAKEDLTEIGLTTDQVDKISIALESIPGTTMHTRANRKKNKSNSGWVTRKNEEKEVDLSQFEVDYESLTIGKKIGEGGFATVHEGIYDGKRVGIKVMKFDQLTEVEVRDFRREVAVLSRLDHKNIIKFIAVTTKPPNLTLVMEYVERGDFSVMLMNKQQKLPWKLRLSISRDVAAGISYLHNLNPKIIHRDIKASNVLISNNWRAKVCDFGLSKVKTTSKLRRSVIMDPSTASKRRSVIDPSQSAMGTPAWAAPELLDNKEYSEAVDSYSYGVYLWETLTRDKPFKDKTNYEIVMDVHTMSLRPIIPDYGPKEYVELMVECWDEDPGKRPNMINIISQLNNIMKLTDPEIPN